MVKWNWRKFCIIFPRENEHLVEFVIFEIAVNAANVGKFFSEKNVALCVKSCQVRLEYQKICVRLKSAICD